MRLTMMLALVLLEGCTRESTPARAQFDHWTEPDGTVYWQLTVTPAAWKELGHGEPLDGAHQHISESAVSTVSRFIDANLRHLHLCPGEWTMADVRHFEDDYLIFAGYCDTPAGART